MSVQEELPVGSAVGNLTAVDEDVGENALIDYVITCKLLRTVRGAVFTWGITADSAHRFVQMATSTTCSP